MAVCGLLGRARGRRAGVVLDPQPQFFMGDSASYVHTALTGWVPLPSLLRQRATEEVKLRRLSEEKVAAVLLARAGSPPSVEVLSLVYFETDGNAYFVEEFIRLLASALSITSRPPQLFPEGASKIQRKMLSAPLWVCAASVRAGSVGILLCGLANSVAWRHAQIQFKCR